MRLRLGLPLLVCAVVGCGPHHYLIWNATPPAPTLQGRAAVVVADRREPKRGGEDPSVVGFMRSGWGIPYPIRIGNPMQLTMDVHDLVTGAALSAGLGVVPPGQEQGATSRIAVDIQNFWCDGYWPVYKAGVVMGVTIVDPSGTQVRIPAQPIQGEQSDGDCRGAYRKVLTNVFSVLRAMFSSPQIGAAVVGNPAMGAPPMGAPPPPMGAPPPPPPAQ